MTVTVSELDTSWGWKIPKLGVCIVFKCINFSVSEPSLFTCRFAQHDKMTVDNGGGGQGDGGDTMMESENHEKEMRARLLHYHNSFSSQGICNHTSCTCDLCLCWIPELEEGEFFYVFSTSVGLSVLFSIFFSAMYWMFPLHLYILGILQVLVLIKKKLEVLADASTACTWFSALRY